MTSNTAQPEFPIRGSVPVSVVILTLNEELNIADCLRSCAWCDDVHVVDSGSNDRTIEIAREMGANTYYHPFESFGAQRNWAIDHTNAKHDWIFHLDADERFTPALVAEMARVVGSNPREAGYSIASKLMFMGRWLKRTAGYPTYQMRFFHKTRMRFTDWGHGQRELTDGLVGTLEEPYLHYALSKGLVDFLDRHNTYSTKEALQALEAQRQPVNLSDLTTSDPVIRRRALKNLSYRLPFRATLRYWVTLWILGAVCEGEPGRTYAALMHVYERMITLKIRVLRSNMRRQAKGSKDLFEVAPPALPGGKSSGVHSTNTTTP
ncbi:MAG: glycosyltransferase [Tepidisphaera sp.]|nr:glycosyltransferase [Tepidisphaera sp.]